jgi:hypothetical protein
MKRHLAGFSWNGDSKAKRQIIDQGELRCLDYCRKRPREGVDHIDFIVRDEWSRHPHNITLLFATSCLLARGLAEVFDRVQPSLEVDDDDL